MRAAGLIRSRLDELALTMAYEAGKPMRDAQAEAECAADTFTWSAEEANGGRTRLACRWSNDQRYFLLSCVGARFIAPLGWWREA